MTMKSGTVYIANTARQTATAASQPSARSQLRRARGTCGDGVVGWEGFTAGLFQYGF
ncbi:hypothetical protein CLU88_1850 [Acidovorax sp. 56]|nr:hypothetical protein CLU88_1850 [Acidovorax sp. 56]